jgi:class 3 adenylate cyclase
MQACPTCSFANADQARFCSNCGNALEPARSLEGERRFATVLFADVARSTAIAEQLDPEDWALIMNGAFGFMNTAVSRYGGTYRG